MTAREFVVEADDPCLAGHFPGHPVVPGVVLLDRALSLAHPGGAVAGVSAAKFPLPVLPGETVTVEAERDAATLSMCCLVGGRTVARAVFALG